jgi:hypothetical protein
VPESRLYLDDNEGPLSGKSFDFSAFFPFGREFRAGDWFALDCVHHHALSF